MISPFGLISVLSMSDGSILSCRYVGWRPVGSPPIFSPSYAKPLTIETGAKRGTPPHFNSAHWDEDVRKSFVKATFRARYDGLYVADLYFDKSKTDELSEGQDPIRSVRFLDRAADQISMTISEELRHNHYFHTPKKSSVPSVPWLKEILPLTILSFAIFAFLIWQNGNLTLVRLLILIALGCVTSSLAACILMLAYSEIAHHKLNPDRVLRLRPVRISEEQETGAIEALNLDDQSFFNLATCRKPEAAQSDRLVVGQLRRNIIKVQESASKLVAHAKKSDARLFTASTRFFWFAFFLAIVGITAPMGFVWIRPDFPLSAVQFGLGVATILLSISILSLVYMILCVDLPRVKFLRATSGFISSCEPLNEIISQILRESSEENSKSRSAPNFSHILKTTETQLAGESQRLQVRQFWIAAIGTTLGALIAALAITFSMPGNRPTSYVCHVSPANAAGIITQTCHPAHVAMSAD